MGLKKALFAIGAASMVVSPIAAQATTASASVASIATLSGAGVRQSAAVDKRQKGIQPVIPIAVIGLGAIIAAAIIIADDDGSNGG